MLLLISVSILLGCVANPVLMDSYSNGVGPGDGASFASNGTGRITGIKVWEDINNTYCIAGVQLRYGSNWSNRLGREVGPEQQIDLFDGETIVQASFNFYPLHPDAELQMLSGCYNGWCITSMASHWGVAYDDSKDNN